MLAQKELNKIKSILSSGGIIGIPTDTVYGLACDAFNLSAVEKITKIKGRDASKYYVLQIANPVLLTEITSPLTTQQLHYINKYWPGEITFIFNKKDNIRLPYLASTVGIRIPNHKTTQQILNAYNNPLVVTSLNKNGEPPATCYDEIPLPLNNSLDYLVVSHEKGSQISSTVVDLSTNTPKIIRQGKVAFS